MESRSLHVPPPPPSYAPQWFLLFLIVTGILGYRWAAERHAFQHVSETRTIAAPEGSDWYMVLRMPEIPSAVTDVEATQSTFRARLDALKREGFHPVLLSHIYRHLKKGAGLPSKPVVLVFDPGHRHTFDMLSPVLKQMKVPAVWMTDGEALDHGDRRYVSRHATKQLVRSGLWDVGFYNEKGAVEIQNADEGVWTLAGDRNDVWAPSAGVFAYNPASQIQHLNRLNVNSTWSRDELVDRVMAEIPVRAPIRLAVRSIRNHLWGVPEPLSSPAKPFTLESDLEKRSTTVAWLGAEGVQDASIQIRAQHIVGELWVLMRSDENQGESIRIGFAKGMAMVDQEENHQVRRLAATGLSEAGSVNATIRLQGTQLLLTMNGRPVVTLTSLKPARSKHGVVRLSVYDKLRGTARADQIDATLTPLSMDAPSS